MLKVNEIKNIKIKTNEDDSKEITFRISFPATEYLKTFVEKYMEDSTYSEKEILETNCLDLTCIIDSEEKFYDIINAFKSDNHTKLLCYTDYEYESVRTIVRILMLDCEYVGKIWQLGN